MSVLIKNMKVPKSCDECFVRLSLCSVARKIAKSGGPRMWVPTTYRPDDCPLAEISQPHGRLIDADALIAAHKEVCSRSMKFNLDLAPTIIPAEPPKEET